MPIHRTLLFTAILLTITSIVNADLVLTLNGVDPANSPLEIEGKDSLVISIAGKTQVDANACSISTVGGVSKPITESNAVSSGSQGSSYLFTFEDGPGLGLVSLIANEDIIIDGISVAAGGTIYELALFYNPETDIVIAFGTNLEALNFTPPPQPEPAMGVGLEQYFTASQIAEPETPAAMSAGGIFGIENFPDRDFYPDLNDDDIVNLVDFAMFANNWQKSGSGLAGDFDDSGDVTDADLAIFGYLWLNGPHPLNVFDSFKTALSVSNYNEALTHVSDIAKDKYTDVFQIFEPHLPDYAAGMGELIFDRQRDGEVIYEMSHQDGGQTYLFPVSFIREEDGNWRLFNF